MFFITGYITLFCLNDVWNNGSETLRFYAVICLWYPSLYLVFFVGVTRVWLLYYDTQISKFNLHRQWLTVIDETNETTNWYKKHEDTLGNAWFLIKMDAGIAMIFILVILTVRLLGYSFLAPIIDWGMVCILSIAIGWIWVKLKHFQYDTLGIRHEIGAIVKGGCACFILGAILTSLHFLHIISNEVYNLIWCVDVTFWYTYAIIFCAFYPKYLANKHGTKSKNSFCCKCNCIHQRQQTTLNNVNTSLLASSSSTSSSHCGIGNSWRSIVCTQFGYESLMNHLAKEFAIENLLFISEVCFMFRFVFYVVCLTIVFKV